MSFLVRVPTILLKTKVLAISSKQLATDTTKFETLPPLEYSGADRIHHFLTNRIICKMKPSAVIAALTVVASAGLSSSYRYSSSDTAGTSSVFELTITNSNGVVPTTFATLSRGKKLESTTAHPTADPWPTTFQQFESTTKGPKTHKPKTIRCTEPPAQFPTTFQQFPSVYYATKCRSTKGHHIPDASSAHPTHSTRPAPSILDPWKAHQPHTIITPINTVETCKTASNDVDETPAAHASTVTGDAYGQV